MAKHSFPLKSMTAYGRGESTFSYGRFTVEIQSVNRRFLEVNVGLPRLFVRYEMDIRKKIASRVGRGMVHVSVAWKSDAKQPISVIPNLPLAKGMKMAWERLSHELDLEEKVPLSLLATEKDILLFEEELLDESTYHTALDQALSDALQALISMKQNEGTLLSQDLSVRLSVIEQEIQKIEMLSGETSEKYRQKLSERLEELFSGSAENEERILREVAVLAEKLDITEEIVRFISHIDQFRQMLIKPLENETETRGKTLDFLIQELNREINTIASKASDLAISQHAVKIKSELERIREQVQNIE